MNVLVTGGAGFIGSHTVDALLAQGHRVRILDALCKPVHLKGPPAYLPAAAELVVADVRDKGALAKALAGPDPTVPASLVQPENGVDWFVAEG